MKTREEISDGLEKAIREMEERNIGLTQPSWEAIILAGSYLKGKHNWIPVENYPKVDISCTLLVHYVDGTIDICDYYGDYYDYTGQNVTRNVTHWMPLPPPPRKEENDE